MESRRKMPCILFSGSASHFKFSVFHLHRITSTFILCFLAILLFFISIEIASPYDDRTFHSRKRYASVIAAIELARRKNLSGISPSHRSRGTDLDPIWWTANRLVISDAGGLKFRQIAIRCLRLDPKPADIRNAYSQVWLLEARTTATGKVVNSKIRFLSKPYSDSSTHQQQKQYWLALESVLASKLMDQSFPICVDATLDKKETTLIISSMPQITDDEQIFIVDLDGRVKRQRHSL